MTSAWQTVSEAATLPAGQRGSRRCAAVHDLPLVTSPVMHGDAEPQAHSRTSAAPTPTSEPHPACSPPAGAPHNIDEAAAIWFGTLCPAGNVADVATKRAKSFGTMVDAGDKTCIA